MADTTIEKIYATPTGGSDALTTAALMSGGLGGNQWMNNPFAYLIFMMFANNGGFGGNNAQLQALQSQVADNANNQNVLNAINGSTDAIRQLSEVTGASFAQVQTAISAMAAQMSQGCCDVKQQVISQGYENRLANANQTATILQQSQSIGNAVNNGITSLGFQIQTQGCDIKTSAQENTQRIIDVLNNHWSLEQQTTIQQLRDELGRANLRTDLSTEIRAVLDAVNAKTTTSATASA